MVLSQAISRMNISLDFRQWQVQDAFYRVSPLDKTNIASRLKQLHRGWPLISIVEICEICRLVYFCCQFQL